MNHKPVGLGLVLFALYLAFYSGYIFLCTFRADIIAAPLIAGVNVAIVYGFALIVLALVLALIYVNKAPKA